MNSAKQTFLAAAVITVLTALAPAAHATLLSINTSVTPNAQANPLSGTTILGNTGAQNFNISFNGSSIAGTAQEYVVTGYAGNPFGASNETFVVQFSLSSGTNSDGSIAMLDGVTDGGFGTVFLTDVGYYAANAAQIAPGSANRSTNGSLVNFSFSPPGTSVSVGQSSDLLIINTNATRFTTSALTVRGELTANLSGFAPSVIPEPTSLALCAVGSLGGLAVFLRRRRLVGIN